MDAAKQQPRTHVTCGMSKTADFQKADRRVGDSRVEIFVKTFQNLFFRVVKNEGQPEKDIKKSD